MASDACVGAPQGAGLRLARWAVLATAVVATAAAGPPVATAAATAPAGYQLVTKQFSALQSSFATQAAVACPTGTATWGGGNYLSVWSPPVPIVSTYWNGATPGAWTVAEANTHPFTANFGVMAICARKPLGYKLVIASATAPIAQITGANVLCPTGKVLLSGGLASTSDRTTVHVAGAAPISGLAAFQAFEANDSDVDQTYHVYAICAAKPAGYARTHTTISVGANTQVRLTANCPANTAVIGGGIGVSPVSDGAIPEESHPDFGHKAWVVMLDNTTSVAEKLTAYAICAA